ncbi:HlyC/CorC family transporter [Bacteroides heparinolyticus]|uniref:HlyC/CorC family transporter n=1 Tax=Prevotella heparinolytica TaxID=28113 RepID=UPI0035A0C9B0
MDPSWRYALLILFIALSAFFSSAETAIMSLSKIRLRHLVEEGNTRAKKIQNLTENPGKLLGAILVGNNIVNIGASAVATSIAIDLFGNTGVGIATGIMTLLILIFGEITPKSVAAAKSEAVALKFANIMTVYVRIIGPLVGLILLITNLFTKILGGKPGISQPYITEDEFKTMVDVGHEEGVFEVEEKEMIYNVFDFGDAKVSDVMTPRTEMIALDIHTPYEKVIEVYKEEQFSRLPVYDESIDNIVGILYIKDIVFSGANQENFDIASLMRQPHYTFEFKNIADLLKEMKKRRTPIAVVLDEYGGTAGIVTMEDLIEEIVGDIKDEYDDHEEEIEVIKEDEYLVDGVMRIDELNELIGTHIESDDFDSIGGFIVGLYGEIPEAGQEIEYEGVRFIVEVVDKNRIEKLRIFT